MIFLKSLAVFLGTIIGVGIFGLPYAASKAGFFVMAAYIFGMALAAIAIHLMYAEVCVRTTGEHRFPGYVKEYLGKNWSNFSFVIAAMGMTGALLSYLIVGGEFLYFLFSDFLNYGSLFYTLLFFILGAYLVFKDKKNISKVEVFLLAGLFLILFWFFFKSYAHIEIGNFNNFNPNFFFLPYGIALFSLWGLSVIPELKELMSIYPFKKLRANLMRLIFWGIVFSAFIYLFFVFIVFGVSGQNTSSEAIYGLGTILGNDAAKIGFLFGVICCFTSFIAIAQVFKRTLYHDFKVPKNISWFIACFLPLSLYFLGARDFIKVIGFTGSVFIGIEAVIMVFLYRSFLKQRMFKKMNPLFYLLTAVFLTGIIIEAFYFLS